MEAGMNRFMLWKHSVQSPLLDYFISIPSDYSFYSVTPFNTFIPFLIKLAKWDKHREQTKLVEYIM